MSPQEFHDCLNKVCGINAIHDYYGMVEQTGCIYMQCECGHLHASVFSDVIIRNPKDFSVCENGEKGIIQVVSSIPESYPGHSLLTEDEGLILGEDDCSCGRKGKYFKILGRIKNAEIRGCGDTFAANSMIKLLESRQEITYLVGNENVLKQMQDIRVKRLFDNSIIEFMNDFSGLLMKDKAAKMFPDVITLAFWLRKASVNKFKERFEKDNICMGAGVLFHVAPSNVPVNYAYSLFSGLLCGNANIVRVPSKNFPQVELINKALKETLKVYPEFASYICLVRYEKSKEINDLLSSICDVRVI